MELAFIQVGKEPMLSKLAKDLAYSLYMWLTYFFSIDQNIVQIHNNKDVKLFSKNLIDVVL